MKIELGTWITIDSIEIAELMASKAFDWVCIDIEHTTIDLSLMKSMIMAIQSKGKRAFVRVTENDKSLIKRVLDAGADGLICPNIDSYEEALAFVQNSFYPPLGKRGVGLSRAQGYGFDFPEYRDVKSKQIELIAQIEHIDAINELELITSISEISGFFIGPFDLSASMGKPGMFDDEDVKSVIRSFEDVVKSKNKKMGYHVIEADNKRLNEKIKQGYNFIAFSLDTLFLGTKIDEELNSLL